MDVSETPVTRDHGMSPLGFGCSRLLGPLLRTESLRLLETAFDAGICHFDVARSYGSGDAEAVLGDFLRRHRDEVTVTSKFGIRPAVVVARSRVLVSTARRAMRVAPNFRRALSRTGATLVNRSFDVTTARESLHTSLARLGTDYLDLYLLHDPVPGQFASSELLAFLVEAVAEGKIREFGVAAPEHAARDIVGDRYESAFARAVQCDASVLSRTEAFDAFGSRTVLTFGALGVLGQISTLLDARPDLRSEWSKELDANLGSVGTLSSLLLAYSLAKYRRGPVLISSTKVANVRADAAVARTPLYSMAQLDRFAHQVRTALG